MRFLIALVLLVSGVSSVYASRGEVVFKNQCNQCHGNVGSGMSTPILFGQEPQYILNSLSKFKSGERTDNLMGMMGYIANDLSAEDSVAVAQYVAGTDPCEIDMDIDTGREKFRQEFQAGRQLYAQKNCAHCHDTFHHGAPRLLGQKFKYIRSSLEAFKSGQRDDAIMKSMTKNLSDQDIHNLSVYINGLRLMRSCPE